MKNLFSITIALILIFSCTKEKSNISAGKKVTVTGKIVTDCAGTPFANQRFALLNQGNRFLNTGYENVPFTTDTAGNFSVLCNPTGISGFVEIRLGDDGGRALLSFAAPSDLDIGTLNTAPTANYQIKIKVNNTYSVGDTLLIGDMFGSIKHKIAFPFSDTLFRTSYNYSHSLHIPNISEKDEVPLKTNYLVYSGKKYQSNYVEKKSEVYDFSFEGCNPQINQIEMAID